MTNGMDNYSELLIFVNTRISGAIREEVSDIVNILRILKSDHEPRQDFEFMTMLLSIYFLRKYGYDIPEGIAMKDIEAYAGEIEAVMQSVDDLFNEMKDFATMVQARQTQDGDASKTFDA